MKNNRASYSSWSRVMSLLLLIIVLVLLFGGGGGYYAHRSYGGTGLGGGLGLVLIGLVGILVFHRAHVGVTLACLRGGRIRLDDCGRFGGVAGRHRRRPYGGRRPTLGPPLHRL